MSSLATTADRPLAVGGAQPGAAPAEPELPDEPEDIRRFREMLQADRDAPAEPELPDEPEDIRRFREMLQADRDALSNALRAHANAPADALLRMARAALEMADFALHAIVDEDDMRQIVNVRLHGVEPPAYVTDLVDVMRAFVRMAQPINPPDDLIEYLDGIDDVAEAMARARVVRARNTEALLPHLVYYKRLQRWLRLPRPMDDIHATIDTMFHVINSRDPNRLAVIEPLRAQLADLERALAQGIPAAIAFVDGALPPMERMHAEFSGAQRLELGVLADEMRLAIALVCQVMVRLLGARQ